MQSSATFFEGQPRPSGDGLLCWLRAAAWVVVIGALSPSVLAQAAAESAIGENMQPASEPQGPAAPGAAPQSEPDAPVTSSRRRSTPTGVDAQVRRLTADLNLDPTQRAKIRPILVARSEDMQRLRQDTQLTPAQRRERTLAVGDRSADQIRAVLTDAQRAQFVQPRGTVVAQGGLAGRRGGMAAPRTTSPVKGAAQ